VFPRLYVPCLARSSRNSKTAVFMGVDFQKERDENPALARKRFISGGIPSPLDSSGVVIGTLLAEALHVSVGSRIVMMAQGPGGEIANELFFVSGVIKTGIREFDSTTVIASRSRLGSAVGCVNDAHEISVMLSDPKKIPAVLSIINGILCEAPGVRAYPWNKAMPGLADIIWLYRMMLRIIVIILYLIVGVGTVNTLLMSVMERVREFGVIRALGMDRSGALRMVCAEALVLAAAGTVLGDLFSAFLGLYTSTAGIDISMFIKVGGIGGTLIEPVVYTGWNMKALLTLNIGMICIALAASLYPAYHVTGVKPSEAMRKT